MKVSLIVVGKTDFKYLDEGIALYEGRIKHYVPFEIIYTKDIKKSQSLSRDKIKEAECSEIINKIKPSDFVVLLDEKGKELSSINFSNFLNDKMISGEKKIVFLLGGAYGFHENVYKRANNILSISKMTFSHQMVRLIFLEQLYRAFTIIKGEPYHHV